MPCCSSNIIYLLWLINLASFCLFFCLLSSTYPLRNTYTRSYSNHLYSVTVVQVLILLLLCHSFNSYFILVPSVSLELQEYIWSLNDIISILLYIYIPSDHIFHQVLYLLAKSLKHTIIFHILWYMKDVKLSFAKRFTKAENHSTAQQTSWWNTLCILATPKSFGMLRKKEICMFYSQGIMSCISRVTNMWVGSIIYCRSDLHPHSNATSGVRHV